MLTLSGEAFDEPDTYDSTRPEGDYFQRLLNNSLFISLVASKDELVTGGLAAYEFLKLEQARCKWYIYDLAVAMVHRRE